MTNDPVHIRRLVESARSFAEANDGPGGVCRVPQRTVKELCDLVERFVPGAEEPFVEDRYTLMGQTSIGGAMFSLWDREANRDVVRSIPDGIAQKIVNALNRAPIEIVHHCPTCGFQHVDEPGPGWDNPPHTSHSCQRPGCGTIWRPADVPTKGVARIATAGKTDNWTPGYVVVRHPTNTTLWNVQQPDGSLVAEEGMSFGSASGIAYVRNDRTVMDPRPSASGIRRPVNRPSTRFDDAVCKGSLALGTGCGTCSKCDKERAIITAPSPLLEEIEWKPVDEVDARHDRRWIGE